MRGLFVHSLLLITIIVGTKGLFGQTETATLSGYVTDQNGNVVAGAEVEVTNVETNVSQNTRTNTVGLYLVPNLPPGKYRISVKSPGFQQFVEQDLVLHVQDTVSQNFKLRVGSVSETVTVVASALTLNTQDASVGTVVDRDFVENMPLNGRSFQSLISLAPGVMSTNTTGAGANLGGFNINGQRSDSNSFYVDGVSANSGVANPGLTAFQGVDQSGSGGASNTSTNGGFNTLVSVDDVQEFRIQTSTFAPEFGRTPGGQFSIMTRAGTNNFPGDVFDYFRNTVFDANDWFANQQGLPISAEHQNDFGGVLGGPIVKNKLFFFFSYEGLRLLQPATEVQLEPSMLARTNAAPSLQPFLKAFPIPQGPDIGIPGGNPNANPPIPDSNLALWTGDFSQPNNLDNTSIRIDYNVAAKISLFGRFNIAPSERIEQDGGNDSNIKNTFTAVTLGLTHMISPTLSNDLRFNYTRAHGTNTYTLNSEGGAIPFPASYAFPSACNCSPANAFLDLSIHNGGPSLRYGVNAEAPNRQVNIVDTLSFAHGSHQLKFGADYRRLTPSLVPRQYGINGDSFDTTLWTNGEIDTIKIQAFQAQEFAFNSVSLFAQDTWKVSSRLNLTYGLRWELNPSPGSPDGRLGWTTTPLVAPFDSIVTRPIGTQLYPTTWANFAPRFGFAYQLSSDARWGRVLHGGFGLFYDTGFSASVNDLGPYGNTTKLNSPAPFPVPANTGPPPLPNTVFESFNSVVPDPNLKLPLSYQFNAAVQQQMGPDQVLSVTYVGALGRRLLRPETFPVDNASIQGSNFGPLIAIRNDSTSSYHALQLQFQRRVSHGLQTLIPFTWSHSIDDASSSLNYFAANGNYSTPGFFSRNRGPSDFDVRFSFSPAVSYYFPSPGADGFLNKILGNWATDAIYHYTSAPPNITDLLDGIDIIGNEVVDPVTGFYYFYRPNLVPGQPVYLRGAACMASNQGMPCPGGKRLNPNAFSLPTDPNMPGNMGRNQLRAFSLQQLDLTLRRDFPFAERYKLQFRADSFNLFNHPNFASMTGNLQNIQEFGLATSMLNDALGTSNGFNPLYQVGGPRSFQLSLKLLF